MRTGCGGAGDLQATGRNLGAAQRVSGSSDRALCGAHTPCSRGTASRAVAQGLPFPLCLRGQWSLGDTIQPLAAVWGGGRPGLLEALWAAPWPWWEPGLRPRLGGKVAVEAC